MARTTGDNIGTFIPDNLIAGTFPAATAFDIELESQGEIARGTVMALCSDGKYAILGAKIPEAREEETTVTAGAASCIIAADTDADDTVAAAYRTGCFNYDALITADGYKLTAEDENNLRLAGIVLSKVI